MSNTTIELIKLFIISLTPILIFVFGILAVRKIEKNKLDILKEKEWQVKWADLFIVRAQDFNKHLSITIVSLHKLQTASEKSIPQITHELETSLYELKFLDWDIRNFIQFANSETENELISLQAQLLNYVDTLLQNKHGSLETIREIQIKYNDTIRIAHSQILKRGVK